MCRRRNSTRPPSVTNRRPPRALAAGIPCSKKADDPQGKLRTLAGERLDHRRRFGLSSLVGLVDEALLVSAWGRRHDATSANASAAFDFMVGATGIEPVTPTMST
jgi:hypothetical protein